MRGHDSPAIIEHCQGINIRLAQSDAKSRLTSRFLISGETSSGVRVRRTDSSCDAPPTDRDLLIDWVTNEIAKKMNKSVKQVSNLLLMQIAEEELQYLPIVEAPLYSRRLA